MSAKKEGTRLKSPKWLVALNAVLISAVILFLMATVFLLPNLTFDQRVTIQRIFAFLSGTTSGIFLGTASLEVNLPASGSAKVVGSFTGGIAVFVFCLIFTPGGLQTSFSPDKVSKTPFRVALFYPADMSYGRKAKDGFRSQLQSNFPAAEVEEFSGSGNLDSQTLDMERWDDEARLIAKNDKSHRYKYLVSIGTQSSEALRRSLGDRYGETPFIFMSVTDPVKSDLVKSLDNRLDSKNVAGTNYGAGIDNLVAMAAQAFPRSRMIFIYRKGVPQDEYVVGRLSSREGSSPGQIQIVSLDHAPRLSDFKDRDAIYVSWYTLETLFDSGKGIEILDNRNVIATTEQNVTIDGRSPLGIAPSDDEIGRSAAKIIAKHFVGEIESLGKESVIQPRYFYSINFNTCRDRRISLSRAVIDAARVKVGMEN